MKVRQNNAVQTSNQTPPISQKRVFETFKDSDGRNPKISSFKPNPSLVSNQKMIFYFFVAAQRGQSRPRLWEILPRRAPTTAILGDIMARTIIQATVSVAALCKLSRDLTNNIGDQAREGLVYLSDSSCGGRRVDVGVEERKEVHAARGAASHIVPDGDEWNWLGFDPASCEGFWWQSASSGATLHALRRDDGVWTLQFAGIDAGELESQYVFSFALAAELETLETARLEPATLAALETAVAEAGDEEWRVKARMLLEALRAVEVGQ